MSGRGTPEHPIERAERLIADQPVLALDAVLSAFADTRGHRSPPDTQHYLDVTAGSVLRASKIDPDPGHPMEQMFSETSCDALATAALLRLLVLDDEVFDDPQLRSRAFVLFDRRLGTRVYGRLGLTANSQTFEKRDALRAEMEILEATLFAHVESFSSLAAVAAFRQRLLQLFSDPLAALGIAPFLPPSVSKQMLSELLAAAEACGTADDDHLLQEVDRAGQLLDTAQANALAFPTTYSRALLVEGLQSRLRDLLAQLVRQRGLADPAAIRVAARPKLYPLRTANAPVVVRVDVVNAGPGHATEVDITVDGQEVVAFPEPVLRLGRLQPGQANAELRGYVREPGDADALLIKVTWRNPDSTVNAIEDILELAAQTRDVPWDALDYEQPYSLEPAKNAADFAGRDLLLSELMKIVLGREPGNVTIDGQKRVGKTSLAYALRDRVEKARPGAYSFLFLECGDFTLHTPEATLARLGLKMCSLAAAATPDATDVAFPDLSGGLAPTTDFFEQLQVRAPTRRFIVVLDDFDGMAHPELYELGRIGTTFFQTLRALGGKANLGFVLIGSERMTPVLTAQEQHVNKFRRVQVDYFDDAHYSDFAALIREPVKHWLSIDDEAVREWYEQSAGNPYIAKAIGISVFNRAVAARDADVRVDDVHDAVAAAVPQLGPRAFAHFWDDGISGEPAQQVVVSRTRRRTLLGLAACLRDATEVTATSVATAAAAYGVNESDAREVLRRFRERRILLESGDGTLRCRVPLFARWLATEGVHDIAVTMGDDDAIIARTRTEEEARIRLADLESLTRGWGTYRGRAITPERVRDWLLQFGAPTDQRLMLKLLGGLRFYGGADIRAHLRDLHASVLRDLKATYDYEYKFRGRQRVRSDLVVTALDDGGSGATHLLKPYRDENGIAAGHVVSPAETVGAVGRSRERVRALLILEDFLGTGATAVRRLRDLHERFFGGATVVGTVDFDTYLLVIAGFDGAVEHVRRTLAELDWPARIHVAQPLGESDRCFSASSTIFEDEAERLRARALATERGGRLTPAHPLGHEDSEALVIFESRCPNNTLPILWADNDTWTPLFPRH